VNGSRSQEPQHDFYHNQVLESFAAQPAKRLTLRQLVEFGSRMSEDKLLYSANYVRTELAVRVAHRIRDFQHLPYLVGTNRHVKYVYGLYWMAFERLRKIPPITDVSGNEALCSTLRELLDAHSPAIAHLAKGMAECVAHMPPRDLDAFMDRVLKSRVSRRVLAEQHLWLSQPVQERPDRIGVVCTKCHAGDSILRAVKIATEQCREHAGAAPNVVIDGAKDAIFAYIPEHVEFVLTELLKNAMLATVKAHGQTSALPGGDPQPNPPSPLPPLSLSSDSSAPTLPDVMVTVCENTSDLVFRISDVGGGIPPEVIPRLFSYAITSPSLLSFTKVAPNLLAKASERRPLARLGFGLAMSRVFATYWGGSLELRTLYGHGSDAYFRLGRLGKDVEQISMREI
jgi:hypothetical protein